MTRGLRKARLRYTPPAARSQDLSEVLAAKKRRCAVRSPLFLLFLLASSPGFHGNNFRAVSVVLPWRNATFGDLDAPDAV